MAGSLFNRAKKIFKDEGLYTLFSRTLRYIEKIGKRLFIFEHYYILEHTPRALNEADYIPRIQNITFKMIFSNHQADEIARQGFEDLRDRPIMVDARQCLDKGAVAFCFYAGSELAHSCFIATSEKAKNTFDILPYKIDFAHGQACTGGTVTLPKFRGNGLMSYGYFKRMEYLLQQGYKTSRNAISVNNTASKKAHARFNPDVYAKARLLKIAHWSFWKETPCCCSLKDILQN